MIKKIKFWLYCQSGQMEISLWSVNIFRNKGSFVKKNYNERNYV